MNPTPPATSIEAVRPAPSGLSPLACLVPEGIQPVIAGGDVVDRAEFEALRDLPGKTINADIRFTRSRATSPLVVADNIQIANGSGIDARLSISYNPDVGSKTFNVHITGIGAICRLDVDGPPHRPAGRSHKHSLQTPRCPGKNLPQVIDRQDLAGKGVRELFDTFCKMANITHNGDLEVPDEGVAP